LADIPPACPASGDKALIAIPLAANAVNFFSCYCRRQFGCGATSAGPGIAGTVFACLPKLWRINAMQAQPNLANLQRIAINRPGFSLQQNGIHALGRDRRRSQAKNQQRQGNRKDAIAKTTAEWMGWRITQRTSRETGIPAGLPYLTGFVINEGIAAEAQD
jgi:hypothetical protein